MYRVLLIALCLSVAQTQACNATHFMFTNNNSIAKGDELTCTFKYIQDKVGTLNDVTWDRTPTASYAIRNAKPVFNYRDSKQKATIIPYDTVIITGGYVDIFLNFTWERTGAIRASGTGTAEIVGDELMFSKQAKANVDGFINYDLRDYVEPKFNEEQFSLVSISPPTITDEDKGAILKLLNDIINVTTVKYELEDSIVKLYPFYLRNCLHDEHYPLDLYFEYTWVDPVRTKGTLNIPFLRVPATADIEQDGISTTYDERIRNDSNWQCGIKVKDVPFPPKQYGGSQSFYTLDFVRNMIRYAAQKGQLNTVLTRELWESKMFQFYAGDLYEVIPALTKNFMAMAEIGGMCTASPTDIIVKKTVHDLFNASLYYKCQLNALKQKIADFAVGVELTIEGQPNSTHLNFQVIGVQDYVTFYPYAGYRVDNEDLGKAMVQSCLRRMINSYVFGSGWPLTPPRDFPHFMVEDTFVAIVDSSHVDAQFQREPLEQSEQ